MKKGIACDLIKQIRAKPSALSQNPSQSLASTHAQIDREYSMRLATEVLHELA